MVKESEIWWWLLRQYVYTVLFHDTLTISSKEELISSASELLENNKEMFIRYFTNKRFEYLTTHQYFTRLGRIGSTYGSIRCMCMTLIGFSLG